ncbi:hypothetical protein HHI36_015037 [Cryptolaemus montrouzieri]|uniref:Uncharacterized protein n=1 Tax=Cryptolaemus montrouzieri TaxID=559131 RepID=A0ABD2N5E7_9CUCU
MLNFMNTELCLFGDYNLRSLTWSNDELGVSLPPIVEPGLVVGNIFGLLNLFQVNKMMNSNGSLLDLLFTTNSVTEVRLADYPLLTLDIYCGHPAFEFDVARRITEGMSLSESFLDFSNGSFDKINEYLESIHWEQEFLNSGLDACVERF